MGLAYFSKEEGFEKCINEQMFKQTYIWKHRQQDKSYFNIETEETIKGFPDVLIISNGTREAWFMEFKYSDKSGKIKFQPTQPAFYKNNPCMCIYIIAYNAKSGYVHRFPAECLFEPNSVYFMDEKAQVNLSRVEGF